MKRITVEMIVQTLTNLIDITPQMDDVYFRRLPNDKRSIKHENLDSKLSFEMSFMPEGLHPYEIKPKSPSCVSDVSIATTTQDTTQQKVNETLTSTLIGEISPRIENNTALDEVCLYLDDLCFSDDTVLPREKNLK
jgi:hypothetical protein